MSDVGIKPSRLSRLKRKLGLDSPPLRYELQEYLGRGARGWFTITTSDEKLEKRECLGNFKPGGMYRVLVKDLETGKYRKMLWKHYEPKPGMEMVEGAEEKIEEHRARAERAPTPSEVMGMWAEQVKADLAPFVALGGIMKEIREAFMGASTGMGGGGEMMGEIPRLEFSGKAPWLMHPYIVKYTTDAVKSVVDHGFDRLEKFREQAMGEGQVAEEEAVEEEAIVLPKPSEFRAPAVTEVEPVVQGVEKEITISKKAKRKRGKKVE